jgi:hypothetical protein
MSTGSTSSGVHCKDPCPPSAIVVTSKLIFPNRLFNGPGTVVVEQESAGMMVIPAATAADNLINSRLERLDLVLFDGIILKVNKIEIDIKIAKLNHIRVFRMNLIYLNYN